jgi:hypothetical protein
MAYSTHRFSLARAQVDFQVHTSSRPAQTVEQPEDQVFARLATRNRLKYSDLARAGFKHAADHRLPIHPTVRWDCHPPPLLQCRVQPTTTLSPSWRLVL